MGENRLLRNGQFCPFLKNFCTLHELGILAINESLIAVNMHYAIQWYKSNNAGFVKNIDYGKGMSQIRHVCPNIGIHFWPISMKFCMEHWNKRIYYYPCILRDKQGVVHILIFGVTFGGKMGLHDYPLPKGLVPRNRIKN